MNKEYWYRYTDSAYAPPLDEYDNIVGNSTVYVQLHTYEVIKHTPKGVWLALNIFFDSSNENNKLPWNKRFVLTNARKRFACPTIEEAKESFIARKNAQLGIYNEKIKRIKKAKQIVLRNKGEKITTENIMDIF